MISSSSPKFLERATGARLPPSVPRLFRWEALWVAIRTLRFGSRCPFSLSRSFGFFSFFGLCLDLGFGARTVCCGLSPPSNPSALCGWRLAAIGSFSLFLPVDLSPLLGCGCKCPSASAYTFYLGVDYDPREVCFATRATGYSPSAVCLRVGGVHVSRSVFSRFRFVAALDSATSDSAKVSGLDYSSAGGVDLRA